jgi:hypothetical protein
MPAPSTTHKEAERIPGWDFNIELLVANGSITCIGVFAAWCISITPKPLLQSTVCAIVLTLPGLFFGLAGFAASAYDSKRRGWRYVLANFICMSIFTAMAAAVGMLFLHWGVRASSRP